MMVLYTQDHVLIDYLNATDYKKKYMYDTQRPRIIHWSFFFLKNN